MMTAVETTNYAAFLDQLSRRGHLIPSGERGLYGRGAEFERVRNRVDNLVTRISEADCAEQPRFPPVMPRKTLETSGYLGSFPQLCGTVFSFCGKDAAAVALAARAAHGEDWSSGLSMTGVVLVPAACYPSYPAIAARGTLPEGGVKLDLGPCYVFRNEPSDDPARMQAFHQRELVRIGDADEVLAWRETWKVRASEIFETVGLNAEFDIASDAFFGRGGKLMANSQREQRLKFEALVPIASPEPTAVASFNFHQDHFGAAFGIRLHDGSTASSACVGFGLERIALALFRTHGMDLRDWPEGVRTALLLDQ